MSDRREGEDDVFVKRLFAKGMCRNIVLYGPGELKTMEAGLCFPNVEQPQTP